MGRVITIAGECVPKGRPRFTRNGRVYTPAKTKKYESYVKQIIQYQRIEPIKGACKVSITIYKEPPASWSNKRKEKAIKDEILPVVKPDLDNYIKSVLDACNGLLFDDDNQVVDLIARKRYAKLPYVEIEVEEFKNG